MLASTVLGKDIEKAMRKLLKRINAKPRFADSQAMNVAMILVALNSQLRRGQVFTSMLSTIVQLAHEALDDHMDAIKDKLAGDDIKLDERARIKKQLELRQIEHDAVVAASAQALGASHEGLRLVPKKKTTDTVH